MYIQCIFGAIFVFILCVHCDNAVNYIETKEIYVPSAPQNLSAKTVTSDEIHLSWAPPTTFTRHLLPVARESESNQIKDQTYKPEVTTSKKKPEIQSDQPSNDVLPANLAGEPAIAPERLKDFEYTSYNFYKNDKQKYNDEYSTSDILIDDSYRSKRDLRSHRHRKRRQENSTDTTKTLERSHDVETHQAFDLPIEVKKKSVVPAAPHKDATQIAYVLYYEQGVPRYDSSTVTEILTSEDVKKKNVFPSDLGMEEYSKSTKNLTLLNTSGVLTTVVGFRLKKLRTFTPYKIWVRAFYNFSLDGVKSSDLVARLGPASQALYVLTDVKPPSAPIILNLTCDQPKGVLYLQWRQPLDYNNSLDQYVVSLRKLPEQQPRTRLTIPTNKSDIETTISVNVELYNITRYEVKIYAVTLSVAKPYSLVNGSESMPEEVSSEWCTGHTEAMGGDAHAHTSNAVLAIAVLCALAATAALVYCRCRARVTKCISAAYNYLEEGGERAVRAPLNTYKKPVVNCSPLRTNASSSQTPPCEAGLHPRRPPRMCAPPHRAVPRAAFTQHVAQLHADSDNGFSKEYEIVVAKSAALAHTSHHSHRPENRLKNRYLNITAYDHSRVCVSAGARCGAAGCVGAGRGSPCDYVNANFIDGVLPALSPAAAARIQAKLNKRASTNLDRYVAAGARCGAAGCVGAGRGSPCDYVNANFIDGVLPALSPAAAARIQAKLNKRASTNLDRYVAAGARCGAAGCVGAGRGSPCDYVNANFIDGVLPALSPAAAARIQAKLNKRASTNLDRYVAAGARCGAAGCVGAGRGSPCDYVNANFIDGVLPALSPAAAARIQAKLNKRASTNLDRYVASGARCGAAGCVGAGRGSPCDYVNANFIDGVLPALSPAAAARIQAKLNKRASTNLDRYVAAGARCGAAGCVGAGRGSPCDYVNANFIDGVLPALSPAAAARIQAKLNKRASTNLDRTSTIKPAKPPPNLAEGIESAFLNIEFSGIVESDEQNNDSDSESDNDDELDDVYVDIDGNPTQVKLEWVIWRRRYIATQGPTPATLDAFWRMIWQHKVHTVVMITNLVERGRRKCDMYWPGGGRGSSAQFGGAHVTLLHEDVRAAYTIRWMKVSYQPGELESPQSETDSSRIVVQYHYTVWPDHGTPRHPLAVLPFVRCASTDPATQLVHCSAGVGRTGTYIVLDAQLNQLKLTGTLSPLGFLCRARTQRNHLVQTEEQYVFVHDALLEYVRSGDTEVPFDKAREYLVKLLEPISEDELAVLDLNQKNKSTNDLTNGYENGETSSVKSQSITHVENGSELSINTNDLNSEMSASKSSVRDLNESQDGSRDGMVNGEETEGVYDLGPRSTDTYSKKMQAYNNLSEQEKEEIRRANRVENFALLERMRSLANRHHTYQGPPPVNLLEKQYQLITRSCTEASLCARAPHNAEKNRVGGILPSDSARVMLVPKPGVEGSEYVNASWVWGRNRVRQYCVAQSPPSPVCRDLWRLLWDHTAQLLLALEGDVFWPTEEEKELFVANFRATFVSKEIYIAHRRTDKKSESPETVPEVETNGYRRQESECADDERLIPENSSPVSEPEPAYRFDRTELRLERLSTGTRDLSARKSIANGDLFSSVSEKRNGPKSPKSPSKMSLKNFKIGSPTKFKFPDWGSRTAGTPPDMAPPPPPITPSLTVEEETELHRPCYYFEKVTSIPENIPSDRIIEVTNVSVHSLQDDYQLSVKFIRCSGWLDGDTTDYVSGHPDDNEFVRAVRQAASASEREEAVDRLIEPYKDSFALVEFVAGCQMEFKNGPVVVVDKYGGWRALNFCTLSAACGGARNPNVRAPGEQFRTPDENSASVYSVAALSAHARCGTRHSPHSVTALLKAYCAVAAYTPRLPKKESAEQDSR